MLTKDFELSFDFQKLDNFDIVVQIENEVGVLEYVNEAFCKFHGVTKEDAVGRSCFDFIIPEDRKVCNVENVVSVRDPYFRVEGRSKNKDGKILWLQYVGKAFFDKNGMYAVGTTHYSHSVNRNLFGGEGDPGMNPG